MKFGLKTIAMKNALAVKTGLVKIISNSKKPTYANTISCLLGMNDDEKKLVPSITIKARAIFIES